MTDETTIRFEGGRVLRLVASYDVIQGTHTIGGRLPVGEDVPAGGMAERIEMPGRTPIVGVRVSVDASGDGIRSGWYLLITWTDSDVVGPPVEVLDPYGEWEFGDWEDPQYGHVDCAGCDMCAPWQGRSYEAIRAERARVVAARRAQAAAQ